MNASIGAHVGGGNRRRAGDRGQGDVTEVRGLRAHHPGRVPAGSSVVAVGSHGLICHNHGPVPESLHVDQLQRRRIGNLVEQAHAAT